MSEIEPQTTPTTLSAQDEMSKTNAIIAYALLIGGYFTGITWIIGGIWTMVKRSDANGSIYEDHHDNIITTFCSSIGLSITGIITAFFFIGWLVLLGVFIWSLFR